MDEEGGGKGVMEAKGELKGFCVNHRRGHLTALDPSVYLGGKD